MARVTEDGMREITAPTGNFWEDQHQWDLKLSKLSAGKGEKPLWSFKPYPRERIHPFCSLIENTVRFRSVVEAVGLSVAMLVSEEDASYYDTMGLMTAVMKTHGFRYTFSSTMVLHFGSVSYIGQGLDQKRNRCLSLLEDLK